MRKKATKPLGSSRHTVIMLFLGERDDPKWTIPQNVRVSGILAGEKQILKLGGVL